MPQLFCFPDHVMVFTEHKAPKRHKHLAIHVIVSLDGDMQWEIEGETIRCQGICIDSDVMHLGKEIPGNCLGLQFAPTEDYACTLKKRLLRGRTFAVLEKQLVTDMLHAYRGCQGDLKKADETMLRILGLTDPVRHVYDGRIQDALEEMKSWKTIASDSAEQLSRKVCLSKSRFLHLFREQTGMTFHSYLAFLKLQKTYYYITEGKNITESCLLAGFNSSSHCASTCRRMYGMALSDTKNKKVSV